MAIFKLTINPGYVPNWTSNWEALREFVQNGLDAHDKGHEFKASWNPKTLQLKLTNRGAKLERKHLLLGATSKADDPAARGHFGEGFKLALLVLARNQVKVRIRTGGETWHPEIVHSDEYDADLLQIRTTPLRGENDLTVLIEGISAESWRHLQQAVIPLREKATGKISTPHGSMLTDDDDKGRVFVKDIYVYFDTKLHFGYNFNDLELDRDRKMANPYNVQYQVRKVLGEAVASGALAAKRLLELTTSESDSGEITALNTYGVPPEMGDNLKAAFTAAHGDALPVSSMQEAAEASAAGIRTVVAPRSIAKLFNSDDAIKKRTADLCLMTTRVIQFSELTPAQCDVWQRGAAVMQSVIPEWGEYAVQVVEFKSLTISGSINLEEKVIRVALRVLSSLGAFLGTLVHEYAHRGCPGHGDDHAREMERLFSNTINYLSA